MESSLLLPSPGYPGKLCRSLKGTSLAALEPWVCSSAGWWPRVTVQRCQRQLQETDSRQFLLPLICKLAFFLHFIQVKSDFSKVNERLGGFCLSFPCFSSPFPHSLPSFSFSFFGLFLFRWFFFQSSLIYRASRCCGLDIFIKTQSLPLDFHPLDLITAEWAGDKARGSTEKTEHCSSAEQMNRRCIYLRNIWVNNILSFISYGVPKGLSESILVTT